MEEELFDVVDEDGRPVGHTKPRRLVHRDGDWHRSLHLWLLLPSGGVVLQRRGLDKDTFPGRLDVSVAGHLRAGETLEDSLREADEELGVTVPLARTVALGRRRLRHEGAGIRDFEVQAVLGARLLVPLEGLVPGAPEVLGAVELTLDGLLALAAGAQVSSREKGPDGVTRVRALEPSELVPRPDGYYDLVVRGLRELEAGREPVPFELPRGP